MVKKVLTIAGSDSSGGAGVQADIKTMSALGAYAMSVICSVTAQNTTGVFDVCDIPAATVERQIDAVFEDIEVDAVKIGMVSSREIIEVIAARLSHYKPPVIVVDPVMVSTSGSRLLQEDAVDAVKALLLPLATLVTPNLPEAEVLCGQELASEQDVKEALHQIHQMGSANVLIKGGHGKGDAKDYLLTDGKIHSFTAPRVQTRNTHGTGCTLSSAIATLLAGGQSLPDAVSGAKQYVTGALQHTFPVGHGHGPVNHFWQGTVPKQ
jgi:hydroxymethylpyrimidine/phosphomethylpyrimidine kinase